MLRQPKVALNKTIYFHFMNESVICFFLGIFLCGTAMWWWVAKLKNDMSNMISPEQVMVIEKKLRQEIHEQQLKIELQQEFIEVVKGETEAQLYRLQDDHEQLINEHINRHTVTRGQALANSGFLDITINEILGLIKAFERWHADMNVLILHNREMHNKNDEFASIVKQMVIVSLNASIEAARAGHLGSGFAVVASEVRNLANLAERLSTEYRSSLYENDLITTTTFQDLQAGGKMIMAAIIGLAQANKKSKEAIDLLAA